MPHYRVLNMMRYFFIGILIPLLVACGSERPFFEGNQAIEDGVWKTEDQPRFELDIQDTISLCHFFINIRHAGNYPYNNLYLFLHTGFPNGRSSKDTIELLLAHPDGRWKGKGTGNLLENRYMVKYARRFPIKGAYQFKIEHAMREEELPGIDNIGFRLDFANKGKK